MGRNSKFTPEVKEKIIKAVLAGNYMQTSAAYAGIGESTLRLWLSKAVEAESKQGKKTEKERELIAFLAAVQEARATAEVKVVTIISSAAQGREHRVIEEEIYNDAGEVVKRKYRYEYIPPNLTAATWFLEHSFPQKWGRREYQQIGIDVNLERDKIDMDKFTVAEIERLLLNVRAELRALENGEEEQIKVSGNGTHSVIMGDGEEQ